MTIQLNFAASHQSIKHSKQAKQLHHGQNISDEHILHLLGSRHSFDQGFSLLVQAYRELLYWHIRRIVQTHEDTDDVLQNTFIKAYMGIESFEGRSKLSTWLFRIGTNEAITFMQMRAKKSTDSIESTGVQIATLQADTYSDSDSITEFLSKAIETLPEKQRVVFQLRYFDELPYEEMSQILNTSVGALKASFHHAVKKIEQYLTEKDL